jgi:hypothetical protein
MMQNVAANRKRLSSRKEFRLLSLSRLNKSFHNLWNGSLPNLLKREFLRLLKRMCMLFPFHAMERRYRFPFHASERRYRFPSHALERRHRFPYRSLFSLSNLSQGHQ